MLEQHARHPQDEAIAQRLDAIFERGIEYEFFPDVLGVLLNALNSTSGAFAYLDEFGDIACAAVRGAFARPDGANVYHARDACQGSWATVLTTSDARIVNEPERVLAGGLVVIRNLTVPIVFGSEVIGLLCAADAPAAYEASHELTALRIAKSVAPYLYARNSQRRFRRQLTELEEMANAAAEGERFFMLSGDLMAIVQDRIVRANPTFWNHLGWEDHELRDRALADLAHPADREAFSRDLARMRTEPNREQPPIVVRMLSKLGNYHSIEWSGAGTEEGRVYVVGRDVSELRSAVARLAAQNEELHALHEQVRREQRTAGHLLANVRRQGCLDMPGVRHLTSPIDFFNGDVALAATTQDGELRWMVGDFTGHGLSAAVGTIPIASAFYATCRKGVPLVESIETVNDILKTLLPPGLFCAAAFLSLDRNGTELTVWNGGLPAVIVRCTRDGRLRLQNSQSLPLGLVTSRELGVQAVRVPVEAADEIFVYSDGLTEATNSAGELFGQERVGELLSRPGNLGEGFDLLLGALQKHRGLEPSGDDVSLVVVSVGALKQRPEKAESSQR